MPKSFYPFAFIALLLWLLGNLLGAHGHFCFDGQEPPLSVHVHLDGHHSHEHGHHPDDSEHLDADVELLQLVIAKFSKIDIALLLLAVLSLLLAIGPRHNIRCIYRYFFPATDPHLRPRLRAPPLAARVSLAS